MVYSIDELKGKITPVTQKYEIPAVYIFGSYARGEATDESDVDVLIDIDGSKINTMFDLGALYNDLNENLGKQLDLVTEDALEDEESKRRAPWFEENLRKDMVVIYDRRGCSAHAAYKELL